MYYLIVQYCLFLWTCLHLCSACLHYKRIFHQNNCFASSFFLLLTFFVSVTDLNVRLYLTHAFFLLLNWLHSLLALCLSMNSCAFFSWICFRVLCLLWCFTDRASFSVAYIFSLCSLELDGPAQVHDNSLRTWWSPMNICSFYFIGAIIFVIPENFISDNLKIYFNLKEESGYLFCALSLFTEFNVKELAAVSSYYSREWKVFMLKTQV